MNAIRRYNVDTLLTHWSRFTHNNVVILPFNEQILKHGESCNTPRLKR